jgi:hypothetical protein
VIAPWLAVLGVLATAGPSPRRFLIAVGQNVGDASDARLSYAESDAQSVARAFADAGGVRAEDLELLLDATPGSLEDSLVRVENKLSREGRPADQLFIYISSHADEGELHLKGKRFRVARVRDFLQRAPVGVAILVLDSCRSGAATRSKGFRALPKVMSADTSSRIQGRVIITSSSPSENSQESDTIQGSYFTSHWVAGLRGMADASGDGRVTLEEAYTYAYQRTIESTFSTAGGTQHPNFSVDLRGEGELVLSEPRRIQSQLVIDVAAPGEYLVKPSDASVVVSHFYKPEGPISLALPPGSYRVQSREGRTFREGSAQVASGGTTFLRSSALIMVQGELASLEKGAPPHTLSVELLGAMGRGVFDGLTPLGGAGGRVHGGLGSPWNWATPVWMVDFSYLAGRATEAPAFAHQEISGLVGAGLRAEWGVLSAVGGLEAGVLWGRQQEAPVVPSRDAWAPQVQGTVGAQLRFSGAWALSLSVWGGPAWIRAQTGAQARFRAGGGLGVAFNP